MISQQSLEHQDKELKKEDDFEILPTTISSKVEETPITPEKNIKKDDPTNEDPPPLVPKVLKFQAKTEKVEIKPKNNLTFAEYKKQVLEPNRKQ